MSCINSCHFTGRITNDTELKFTTTEKKRVCTFSIACERGFGEKKRVTYPIFVAWNGQAEFVSKLSKGTMIAATAEMTERSWTDKQGIKRRVTEFTVTDIQAMETRRATDDPCTDINSDSDREYDQQEFTEVSNDGLPF